MLTVIERLVACTEEGDEGEYWQPEVRQLAAFAWHPRPLRFPSALLDRFTMVSRGWTLRHMFRAMHIAMRRAVQSVTPEMEWMRRVPASEIRPSGNENSIPRTLTWGKP